MSETIPFYDGILGVKPDALLGSWAGEPDVDEPRSGGLLSLFRMRGTVLA